MSEAHIQIAIRDFLENSRLNAYNPLLNGLAQSGQTMPAGLPSLTLQQIRAICKAQEQTVPPSLPRFSKK